MDEDREQVPTLRDLLQQEVATIGDLLGKLDVALRLTRRAISGDDGEPVLSALTLGMSRGLVYRLREELAEANLLGRPLGGATQAAAGRCDQSRQAGGWHGDARRTEITRCGDGTKPLGYVTDRDAGDERDN